jgi:broad specificity phosphatase PhoE
MIRSLVLLLATIAFAAESPVTVILVRHAERASTSMASDVGISEAGRCRAELLAGMLTDAGVTAIYTSEVARTKETAAPLAKKLGIAPQVVAAKETESLVSKLRAANGQTVLVVGHSNTVPEIAKLLGAKDVAPIADAEYDRMLIVTGGKLVTLHFPGCK